MPKTALPLVAAATALVWLAGPPARGQGHDRIAERRIKAAMLYNFVKFVNWPGGMLKDSGTINLCVAGDRGFSSLLEKTVQGKSAAGRQVRVRNVETLSGLEGCWVLFLAGPVDRELAQAREAMKGAALLTVGESPGFAARGVMINFFLEDDRVKFNVNVEAVRAAGLSLSSELLDLARTVKVDPATR